MLHTIVCFLAHYNTYYVLVGIKLGDYLETPPSIQLRVYKYRYKKYLFLSETSCGKPPNVPHSTWEILRYTRDREAKYRCTPGYEGKSGSEFKRCHDDGKWYGKNLICKGKIL